MFARILVGLEFTGVGGIEILQRKFFSAGHPIGTRHFDDLLV